MPAPIYIFEDSQHDRFSPLTYARPVFGLRCGGMTLLERMVKAVQSAGAQVAGVLVRPHLAATLKGQVGGLAVNPAVSTKEGVFLINGRWLALGDGGGTEFVREVMADSAGVVMGGIAWMALSSATAATVDFSRVVEPKTLETVLADVRRIPTKVRLIARPWELLTAQAEALAADFPGPAKKGTIMPGVHLIGEDKIHIAGEAKIWPGAVLDATAGPIVIEEGTEIRANAVITGPVHIGKNCVVRTGADLRELTTLGPGTRVGGEVMHSIFQGNANKQHHGFVGQTMVGEWANLGAGTTTSNLKNTYGTVRVPINGVDEESGQRFLGSLIGDHAKLGIGTYLSTGTVVGYGSHVLAARPPKFVPSFGWVTDKGIERVDFEKVEEIARTVMSRRGAEFGPAEHDLMVKIATEEAAGEKFEWKK